MQPHAFLIYEHPFLQIFNLIKPSNPRQAGWEKRGSGRAQMDKTEVAVRTFEQKICTECSSVNPIPAADGITLRIAGFAAAPAPA